MLFPDRDLRVAQWPFMEDGTSTTLIILSYLLFIKVLGPAYMKERKPYDLRILMIFYNFAMVVYSAWMFYKFGVHGWFGKYSFVCEPVNYSEDEDAMAMADVCWHFFVSKIVELLDTVFFVLRKKNSSVTYLHVVHHSLTPLMVRYAASHGSSGYNTLVGFANTFVHIWMYLYYGLAAVGPEVQKYLMRWKKYLTTLQMGQLVFLLTVLLSQAFNPVCETNWTLILVSQGPTLIFLLLFLNFYRNSYGKRQRRRSAYVTPDKRALDADATEADDRGTELKRRSHREQNKLQELEQNKLQEFEQNTRKT